MGDPGDGSEPIPIRRMDWLAVMLTGRMPAIEAGAKRGCRDVKKWMLLFMLPTLVNVVSAADVIDPSMVVPGTTGVCLTEMDGGEMVEIPLTVIGTVGPSTPEGEMVLVRLEDERFRETGIIAGMSGSPVYVDGRLLGALAFGWSFQKEPIGGVTPFTRMETLADESDAGRGAAAARPDLAEIMAAAAQGALGEMLTSWLLPSGAADAAGLPIAVTSAGWRPGGDGWLADGWRRLGWVAVPGGASSEPAPGELVPGAMVAAVLVDGDAVLAAGGTVTEVRDGQVWAFGHPFLGAGSFRVPMARASVVTVMPSQASSFKFFTVGEELGSFSSDRSRGIWGTLGDRVPMVPVRVEVDGRSFDFRMIRHPGLSPFLAAYLVQTAQASRGRMLGDQTIDVEIELAYAGYEPLSYRETLASGNAPEQAAALVAAFVGYFENTAFELPGLDEITIRMTTDERLQALELVDATPLYRVVAPGDELPVRLRLRARRGGELIREITVRVPLGTPDGRIDLVVADGASWSVYDLGMRPLRPGSFADELRLAERIDPSTSVIAALESRQPGVAVTGGAVTMPPSLVLQLRGGVGSGVQTTSYVVVARSELAMGVPVAGAARIELRVRGDRPPRRGEVQ